MNLLYIIWYESFLTTSPVYCTCPVVVCDPSLQSDCLWNFFPVHIATFPFMPPCIACVPVEASVGNGVHAVSGLVVVDIFTPNDLVDHPVENIKNQEDQWESHSRDCVDLFCSVEEKFPHLVWRFGRWRVGLWRAVVALDGHSILGLQAGGPHPIGGEAETPLNHLILL